MPGHSTPRTGRPSPAGENPATPGAAPKPTRDVPCDVASDVSDHDADSMPAAGTAQRASAPAAGWRWSRLQLVFILGALSAAPSLAIDMYLPALPALAGELGASATSAQLSLTACLVGLAVGQVLTGPWTDSRGRCRPVLIGTAAFTVASALCALAPGMPALIGLRALQGITAAVGLVVARAVVTDLYTGPAAARFFSAIMVITGVAPSAAPLVGGQLLRITSWRGVFWLVAAIAALVLAATALGLRETLPARERSDGGLHARLRVFAGLLADRHFLGYTLALGASFGGLFAVISGSPFVLQDRYGMSPQGVSVVLALSGLAIIAAGQLSARFSHRLTADTLLYSGLVLGAVGGLILLATGLLDLPLPAAITGLALTMAAVGLVLPNATALAMADRSPTTSGSASALMGLAQFALGGLAAPLTGLISAQSAIPLAVIILAVTGLAIPLTATLTRRDPTTTDR